jgi:hypothetical protein
MVKLMALREVYYASKTRQPGDEFEASESDAKILTAHDLGGGPKAMKIEQPTAAQAPAPLAASPESAPQAAPEPTQEENTPQSTQVGAMGTDSGLVPGAGPRRYRRRNLTSED